MFVYGAQFHRPPNPPRAQRRQDIKNFKKLGFNTVKMWCPWNWLNPAEGLYEFEELIEIMEFAAEEGLKVLVNTVLENAPYWLADKYPDALYVNSKGMRMELQARDNTPTGGWPGLCLDHPGALKHAGHFLGTMARTLGKYDNLLLWDCWSEPHIEPVSMSHQYGTIEDWLFCYCEHTKAKYRLWLRKKYGTIDELNKAWFRKYRDWSEINPPRLFGGYPDMMNWRRFMAESVAAQMEWRVEALKKNDPGKHPVMSHSSIPYHVQGLGKWGCDDFLLAEKVDRYGISLFPGWGDNIQEMWDFMYGLDGIRSAAKGKDIWAGELQGGRVPGCPTPTAKHITLWNWLAVACGAKGIIYWQYRDEMVGPESPGFGLVSRSGELTERALEASKMCELFQQHKDFFNNATLDEAKAAILLSRDSFYLAFADKKNETILTNSVRGIYKALWEANILVDFLLDDIEAENLKRYRVIFLPFPIAMSRIFIESITDFVKGGGILISEGCPGVYDEEGVASENVPSGKLSEVFGVTEDSKDPVPKQGHPLHGCGRFDSFELLPSVFLESLGTLTGERILENENGNVAGSVNVYGKGKAYLVGTLFGQSLLSADDATVRFIREILFREDIQPEIRSTKLRIRRLTSGQQVAWVVMNPTNEVVKETVAVPKSTQRGIDLYFGKIVDKRNGRIKLRLEGNSASCIKLDTGAR